MAVRAEQLNVRDLVGVVFLGLREQVAVLASGTGSKIVTAIFLALLDDDLNVRSSFLDLGSPDGD